MLLRNFIEIKLQRGCSPVNLPHIFRIPFLKNTSGWVLLCLEGINDFLEHCEMKRRISAKHLR